VLVSFGDRVQAIWLSRSEIELLEIAPQQKKPQLDVLVAGQVTIDAAEPPPGGPHDEPSRPEIPKR
jgi:hypothetical protein